MELKKLVIFYLKKTFLSLSFYFIKIEGENRKNIKGYRITIKRKQHNLSQLLTCNISRFGILWLLKSMYESKQRNKCLSASGPYF